MTYMKRRVIWITMGALFLASAVAETYRAAQGLESRDACTSAKATADQRAEEDPRGLIVRLRRATASLERCETRNAELRSTTQPLDQPVDESAADVARGCATTGRGPDCSFLEPTQEVLEQMAQCGIVRDDAPNVEQMLDRWTDTGVLSEEETEALDRARVTFRRRFVEELRQLFVEAGGDPRVGEQLPSLSLMGWFEVKFSDQIRDARRTLAEERAGVGVSRPEATIWDRYMAARTGRGSLFEDVLAGEIGAPRARELRELEDGWPGTRVQISGHCPEDRDDRAFGLAQK
jgi:hypothetical protein